MEYCKELADAMIVYALTIEDEQRRQGFLKYCGKWQTRRVRETILRDAQGIYPISVREVSPLRRDSIRCIWNTAASGVRISWSLVLPSKAL